MSALERAHERLKKAYRVQEAELMDAKRTIANLRQQLAERYDPSEADPDADTAVIAAPLRFREDEPS